MKHTALIIATAAMALTSTLASAQSYGGRNDGRYAQQGQYGGSYRGGQTWQRGQRLDNQYRGRDRYVSDYNRYRLRAPPRGYGYYRQDNGDILLAAIATGLIASVIAGNSNNAYQGGYSYGPNYGGSGYGGGNAYGQPSYGAQGVYYDSYGRAYTVDRYGRTVWVR